MINSNLKIILVSFLLYLPHYAISQDISIKAYVSQNSISSDDQFQYSIEVSGSSMSLPEIIMPELKDFNVLGGPNQSTSIQYVNGKQSSSKTYSYYLKPKSSGSLIIPKASVKVKGEIIYSNEVTLTVAKAGVSSPKTQQQTNNSDIVSTEDLFLNSSVSKRKAYIGEQIIIEYKLYFKNQVNGYEVDQMPAATGFWKEDFNIPQRPQIQKEVINGIAYNVATLKKMAVFPTRVGELKIDPMVIKVEVIVPTKRRRRQSLFDSFFEARGQSVTQTAKSKPLILNIAELPSKGRPVGFNGAVGTFDFSVNVDKKNAEVNEAISLKMKLNGTGNLKLADLPVVEIPPDIEQYDPKIKSNVTKTGNNIGGSKQAEYILIPRIPGKFTIKPIIFSYFDPRKKQYITKSSAAISFNITGDVTAGTSAPMAGFSRKEVTMIGSDIRFIKEVTVLQQMSEKSSFSKQLIGGFFISIVFFVGFLFYDDRKAKIEGNKVLARSRFASKLAAKLLSEAKSKLNSEEESGFFKSVNSALSRFVQDKLNIELTDFNVRTARSSLKAKGLPDDLIEDYVDLTQKCDFKEFAGTHSSREEKETVMDKAKNILTRMEKHI